MDNQKIYKEALELGACKERGLDLILRSRTIEDLIGIMKTSQGIEFCMSKGFPSKDMLRQFTKELELSNVFHEGKHTIKNPRLLLVYGGEIIIETDGFSACEVYATNDAKITVVAKDDSYVSVELHNNSKCNSSSIGKSRVKVFNKLHEIGQSL